MSAAASAADRRNRRVALIASAVALAMLGLGYASVPLYRLFCQATGWGGTTQRVSEAQAAEVRAVAGKTIVISYDGNVASGKPWDFAPEVDWRSGVAIDGVHEEEIRDRAAAVASRLARRAEATLFYLPAATPPLHTDPQANAAFARWLESLALGAGARLLPAEAFSLPSYLTSGCPVAGAWLGRVAERVRTVHPEDPSAHNLLALALEATCRA
jgi:hypothetical protein